MDTLATNFRSRRIALGLSQSDIARAAGISRGTLSAFEGGYGRISLANLRRLLMTVGLELATREARRRPTLDELSEYYAASDDVPDRRRVRRKRKA